MLLTERHIIHCRGKKNKALFKQIDSYCFAAKSLYNAVNYHVMQLWRICQKLYRGEILDSWEKSLLRGWNIAIQAYNASRPDKTPLAYLDAKNSYSNNAYLLKWVFKNSTAYKAMPYSTCGMLVIDAVCDAWKAYYMSLKSWYKDKTQFQGMPKHPGYLDKQNGRFAIILSSQQCFIEDNKLVIRSKFLSALHIKTKIDNIHQLRVKTVNQDIVIDLVYEKKATPFKLDKSRILSIDLGVNNLAALVSNFGNKGFILNGRPLKSINQFYNKQTANAQAELARCKQAKTSEYLKHLINKRNNKVDDYMHKASRLLVGTAVENNAGTIVIGYNSGWKQECKLGKRTNQNFVDIPFERFMHMVEYKAKLVGVVVKRVPEAYTSGTSYLDNEPPVKQYYKKSRRVHRGLFAANNGTYINADINAAYQMMKVAGYTPPLWQMVNVSRVEVA